MKTEEFIIACVLVLIVSIVISSIFFENMRYRHAKRLVINIILISIIIFCLFLMIISRILEWNMGIEIVYFISLGIIISRLIYDSIWSVREINDKMR